ncbi:SANT/Myb domain [Dillenia turbinata]|uniref:SANT/Myb domain n=1 Tax=Dillenia turbinata TaxID=194707 RepID=A0AAN8UKP2_9MAGN
MMLKFVRQRCEFEEEDDEKMPSEETCSGSSSSSSWTLEEDKLFENAIATNPENSDYFWEKVSEAVPGKSMEEIMLHYEALVEDVKAIESGLVGLPNYDDDSSDAAADSAHKHGSDHGGKGSRSDQERRRGTAWTEDEHRMILGSYKNGIIEGTKPAIKLRSLEKYGKGDWRSISRNFVVTRTPTQVASHAQKYFIRLNSTNKDRRRSSIHDITSVTEGDTSNPQGPITGQTSGSASEGSSAKTANTKQPTQIAPVVGLGVPSMGQPMGVPPAPAIGTPVNLPAPVHFPYGIRAPAPGPGVPGASVMS